MNAILFRFGSLWKVTFYFQGEFDHSGMFETAFDARLWCKRQGYTLTRAKNWDRP